MQTAIGVSGVKKSKKRDNHIIGRELFLVSLIFTFFRRDKKTE